jgi:hypothetical protein
MIQPNKFSAWMAEYGSLVATGDPGWVGYSFDEDGIIRSEAHRDAAIQWMETEARAAAALNDDPTWCQYQVNECLKYLRAAPIGVRPDVPLHVEHSFDIQDLPMQCITECSAPGDVTGAVECWRTKLRFSVNLLRAREYLLGTGAWDEDEVAALSDDIVAGRILWMACCDFAEYDPEDDSAGSDVFCLED